MTFSCPILTFGIIPDHQQSVPTHHLARGSVHKHQGWDTGHLVLVPQLHLHGKKHIRRGRLAPGRPQVFIFISISEEGGKRLIRAKFIHFSFFFAVGAFAPKVRQGKKERARERKVRAVYIFHRANTLCVVSKRLWRHGGRMKNRGVQSAPR